MDDSNGLSGPRSNSNSRTSDYDTHDSGSGRRRVTNEIEVSECLWRRSIEQQGEAWGVVQHGYVLEARSM